MGNEVLKIVIPVPPKAKGRPRFGKGHTYTPERTEEYEETVRWYARMGIKEPLRGEISVKVIFYLPIPKKTSKAKFKDMVEGRTFPTGKPDIDNLCKAVLDSLNGGIGYYDDKQIVKLYAEKRYGEEPRTEIEMEEL